MQQERKKELDELHSELQARRAAFAESEKESKRREEELAGRLAVTQARLREVGDTAARSKEEQLAAVLAESQVVSAKSGMHSLHAPYNINPVGIGDLERRKVWSF